MKGQTFIILSTILILIIFLVGRLNPTEIGVERIRKEEIGFDNLKEEILRTLQISFGNYSNMSRNVNNFAKFLRKSFTRESMEFDSFFVEIFYPKVFAGTRTELKVTVLNLLRSELRVLNLTFSYDNSFKEFYSVEDESVVETNFSFSTSSNVNYTLTLFYQTSYENRTKGISIPVEVGKSKFIGFFYLKLSNKIELTDELTKIFELH